MSSFTYSTTNSPTCVRCGAGIFNGIVANGHTFCGTLCRDRPPIAPTYTPFPVCHPQPVFRAKPNHASPWEVTACVICTNPFYLPMSSNIGSVCSTRCLVIANERFASHNSYNLDMFQCACCMVNYSFASRCYAMVVRPNAYFCSKECVSYKADQPLMPHPVHSPHAPYVTHSPSLMYPSDACFSVPVPYPHPQHAPHVVNSPQAPCLMCPSDTRFSVPIPHPPRAPHVEHSPQAPGLMYPPDTRFATLAPKIVTRQSQPKTANVIKVGVSLPQPGHLFMGSGFSNAGQFVVIPHNK